MASLLGTGKSVTFFYSVGENKTSGAKKGLRKARGNNKEWEGGGDARTGGQEGGGGR